MKNETSAKGHISANIYGSSTNFIENINQVIVGQTGIETPGGPVLQNKEESHRLEDELKVPAFIWILLCMFLVVFYNSPK